MNIFPIHTSNYNLTPGSGGTLFELSVSSTVASFAVRAPQMEINGNLLQAEDFVFETIENTRKLLNGGQELFLRYTHRNLPEVTLFVFLQTFDSSPFFRIRYRLEGHGARLTKANGTDRFSYMSYALPSNAKLTEIQLSQFETNAHAFLPHCEPHPEANCLTHSAFMGPIALVELETLTLFAAYEHGSEYPDTYLQFSTQKSGQEITLTLEAADGTYYHNQFFDDQEPYTTPWFHLAFCPSEKEQALGQYRTFLLHFLCENPESRKPYVFYNTWNNQERNRAFRGKKYLDDMNSDQILREIDVALRMGVDVFVIDTAWYRATGDWEVDFARYPDGLQSIRAKLTEYGMKLGLWFNPTSGSVSSQLNCMHHQYCKVLDGKEEFLGSVWETEDSFGFCLVSGYTDWYIQKLIALSKALGVTYFKWDAVSMYGCNSAHHRHGTEENSARERERYFGFRSGLELTRIVEEVTRSVPDAIFDLDITEGGRYVGLGFLSVGKFFHMNNGPYYMNFDIPDAQERYAENVNVFFHPGVSRDKVCRQFTKYDFLVPSILFLTHFLPDKPLYSQQSTLASLILGGNGIWGDLLSLDEDDLALFSSTLELYKKIRDDLTEAYPITRGFIGSSPEIYEKINPAHSAGAVVFFTKNAQEISYLTQSLNPDLLPEVVGADSWTLTEEYRLLLHVTLKKDDARIVYLLPR